MTGNRNRESASSSLPSADPRPPASALVLGGGVAGLSAAIHLALDGWTVTLLEQTDALGGKAREVREQGFRFDTGPSVFTLPEVLAEVFAAAGETLPVALTPLTPLCRYLYPSGRVWDVYQDIERTAAALTPAEATAYRNLLEEARRLYEAAAPTFVFGPAPGWQGLMRYGLRHGLAARPWLSLPGLLAAHRTPPDLLPFFLRFATYVGADPYRAPAVLHNVAWAELGLGVQYPEGGIYRVVEALEGLARRLGVTVKTGCRVTGLETAAGRVTRVHAGAESFVPALVVSALDLSRTYRLLGRSDPLRRRPPSLSGVVLLLGLEGETPGLAHHTISFPTDYAAEFAAIRAGRFPGDPTLYLNVSSRSDPADAPPGCENWFVMANAPALPHQDFRSEAAYAEHLLGVLERRGFPVRERLRFKRVLGPQHLAGLAERGSIYGAAPHGLLGALRHGQRVPGLANLFLAGGTVHPGGGLPLALLSGRAAARAASRARRSNPPPNL